MLQRSHVLRLLIALQHALDGFLDLPGDKEPLFVRAEGEDFLHHLRRDFDAHLGKFLLPVFGRGEILPQLLHDRIRADDGFPPQGQIRIGHHARITGILPLHEGFPIQPGIALQGVSESLPGFLHLVIRINPIALYQVRPLVVRHHLGHVGIHRLHIVGLDSLDAAHRVDQVAAKISSDALRHVRHVAVPKFEDLVGKIERIFQMLRHGHLPLFQIRPDLLHEGVMALDRLRYLRLVGAGIDVPLDFHQAPGYVSFRHLVGENDLLGRAVKSRPTGVDLAAEIEIAIRHLLPEKIIGRVKRFLIFDLRERFHHVPHPFRRLLLDPLRGLAQPAQPLDEHRLVPALQPCEFGHPHKTVHPSLQLLQPFANGRCALQGVAFKLGNLFVVRGLGRVVLDRRGFIIPHALAQPFRRGLFHLRQILGRLHRIRNRFRRGQFAIRRQIDLLQIVRRVLPTGQILLDFGQDLGADLL